MSASVSTFESTAASLRLSKEATARAWEMLREIRVGPEDPEAVRVLLHVAMQQDAALIKSAARAVLDEARNTIGTAAKDTAGHLSDAAAKVERASAAKMSAHQAELVSSVGAAIAASADQALTRKVSVHSRNTLAGWIAAALLASVAMGGLGFYAGRANEAATAGQLSAMLQREDGGTWLALMNLNNATGTLANYCRSGLGNLHRVDGGTYCEVPLWVQRDGVVSPVPGRPVEGGAVLAEAGDWLASCGPWWLLAAGAVGLLLIRKAARLLPEFPPLRWLLDIPLRPKEEPAE